MSNYNYFYRVGYEEMLFDDEDDLRDYIAENEVYSNDEELLEIIDNEVIELNGVSDVYNHCVANGIDPEEYDIFEEDLKELRREANEDFQFDSYRDRLLENE